MTDPAIRAALVAATDVVRRKYPGVCEDEMCVAAPCECVSEAAAAVAAFLRALPKWMTAMGLAAAVEEAARDE